MTYRVLRIDEQLYGCEELPEGQLVCGDRGTRRRRRCKSALHRGRETGP